MNRSRTAWMTQCLLDTIARTSEVISNQLRETVTSSCAESPNLSCTCFAVQPLLELAMLDLPAFHCSLVLLPVCDGHFQIQPSSANLRTIPCSDCAGILKRLLSRQNGAALLNPPISPFPNNGLPQHQPPRQGHMLVTSLHLRGHSKDIQEQTIVR